MDYIHFPYRAKMRLFAGSSQTYWVRWYKAPPDARLFPGPTRFRSSYQMPEDWWNPPLGEVRPVGHSFSAQGNVRGYRGQCFVGNKDWFLNGVPLQFANPLLPVVPPNCCRPANPFDARGGLKLGGRVREGFRREVVRGGIRLGGRIDEGPSNAIQGGVRLGGRVGEDRPATGQGGVRLGGRVGEQLVQPVQGGVKLGGRVSDARSSTPRGGVLLGGNVGEGSYPLGLVSAACGNCTSLPALWRADLGGFSGLTGSVITGAALMQYSTGCLWADPYDPSTVVNGVVCSLASSFGGGWVLTVQYRQAGFPGGIARQVQYTATAAAFNCRRCNVMTAGGTIFGFLPGDYPPTLTVCPYLPGLGRVEAPRGGNLLGGRVDAARRESVQGGVKLGGRVSEAMVQPVRGGLLLGGQVDEAADMATKYIRVVEAYTNGTNGGSLTGGTYTKRTLTGILDDQVGGITLASGGIVLPAGTYRFRVMAFGDNCDRGKLKLLDVTHSADLDTYSISCFSWTNYAAAGMLYHEGRFTLSGTTTVEVWQYAQTSSATYGKGVAVSAGDLECFCIVVLEKE